jgi:Cu-processing system permease protein
MRALGVIVHLTLHEAMRRRILLAALISGAAFLTLYAIGFHFIARETESAKLALLERRIMLTFITLAGLYVVNFLVIVAAVMLPVDTLSGEIASGVMQTLAAKPVRRAEIVVGKWIGHAIVLAGYFAVMAGGVLLVARLRGHFTVPGIERGLPLMLLEGLVMLSLAIAGGARFSTITNGIVAFGFFGVAFIGGWVEQIGTHTNNDATRTIGTIASLIMPTEALWQRAAHFMQPPIMAQLAATPFSPASVPSPAMVWWAIGWSIAMVGLGVVSFRKRAL